MALKPFTLCHFNPAFDRTNGHWNDKTSRNLWGGWKTFTFEGREEVSMDGHARGVLNTATFILLPGRLELRHMTMRYILVMSYAHVVGTKSFAPGIRLCDEDDIVPVDMSEAKQASKITSQGLVRL